METNTKLERPTIETLIKACEPPIHINYKVETEMFAVWKDHPDYSNLSIYGTGPSLMDALIDFFDNLETLCHFYDSNYISMARYLGHSNDEPEDVIDQLKSLTDEEQV